MLNVSGEDWKKLKKAVEIRNSITHPKSIQDMIISEDDFKRVTDFHDWFAEKLNKFLGLD